MWLPVISEQNNFFTNDYKQLGLILQNWFYTPRTWLKVWKSGHFSMLILLWSTWNKKELYLFPSGTSYWVYRSGRAAVPSQSKPIWFGICWFWEEKAFEEQQHLCYSGVGYLYREEWLFNLFQRRYPRKLHPWEWHTAERDWPEKQKCR